MARKTWFLPPDFTFSPDGAIALGGVIPDPQLPTTTLASLTDHPTITLPEITSIIEKSRSFSTERNRSFGFGLFAKVLIIANINGNVNVSWFKNKSFGAVDHVVQAYNGAFSPTTLKEIVALEAVGRHINSGRFGKRHVYVISGLRIAQQSFTVTDEQGKMRAISLEGSAPMMVGTMPAELGGNVSGTRGDTQKNGYETAPGIVFAYRLHVIRPKRTGEEGELFSDRTAFFSGEAENDDDEEELEIIEVNGEVLRQDLDLEPDSYDEKEIEGEDECYVVLPHDSK
ncbi:hypothetical protein NPX13_g6599 [Xylaria arbuscula]|uniref:Uncharacterized protein n=1 Tax=Xylaria arbuscula TaxID=114810 RepID=A0A9W8NCK0_9PEZI|nr:hypothetical protein NPX13_g6599 [Xylaria arbuscula]